MRATLTEAQRVMFKSPERRSPARTSVQDWLDTNALAQLESRRRKEDLQ